MRNIDVAGGLCNGTRLRVNSIGKRLLICTILTGKHKGENAFIITRFQYPIKLCYTMTVHKAQGQTFDHVGVDFSGKIFTHGLVYVAISRCTSMENLRIFITPEERKEYLLENIVFRDLLELAVNPLYVAPPALPPPRAHSPLPEYLASSL
jgi:hypothetical protein